jgi:hypothetical protein
MNEKNLIAALLKIKAIAEEALGDSTGAKPERKSRVVRVSVERAAPTTLPQHIMKLRDAGFFKEPRVAAEVHAKLQTTYHCAADRVVMALLRLKNARKLRKTAKMAGKKKLVAYVW